MYGRTLVSLCGVWLAMLGGICHGAVIDFASTSISTPSSSFTLQGAKFSANASMYTHVYAGINYPYHDWLWVDTSYSHINMDFAQAADNVQVILSGGEIKTWTLTGFDATLQPVVSKIVTLTQPGYDLTAALNYAPGLKSVSIDEGSSDRNGWVTVIGRVTFNTLVPEPSLLWLNLPAVIVCLRRTPARRGLKNLFLK